jgi:hypothetical protein
VDNFSDGNPASHFFRLFFFDTFQSLPASRESRSASDMHFCHATDCVHFKTGGSAQPTADSLNGCPFIVEPLPLIVRPINRREDTPIVGK